MAAPSTGDLSHSRVQADLLEGHQLPRALVASLVHHAVGALPDLLHLLKHLLEGIHGAPSALRRRREQLALLRKNVRNPQNKRAEGVRSPRVSSELFWGSGSQFGAPPAQRPALKWGGRRQTRLPGLAGCVWGFWTDPKSQTPRAPAAREQLLVVKAAECVG